MTTTCPKCEAPMSGETCDICADFAALKERITFRNRRRYRVPGAHWAGQQTQKPHYEQPPENFRALPPSDR